MQTQHLHIVFIWYWISVIFMPAYAFNFEADFKLITTQKVFTAGTPVTLEFTTKNNTQPQLYVSNSFGATLLTPTAIKNRIQYSIPQHIASKTGVIYWSLRTTKTPLNGQLTIVSAPAVDLIQTYLGPPSISAGANDYTMLVAIPTDAYDNPLTDGTKVAVKRQFLNTQRIDTVTIQHSISYKNIFSTLKTGRILISSSCYAFNSKEYDVNVMPAPPYDFKIRYHRHHHFADGNQITTFTTSTIKDAYGNTTSDGTYVEFFIKTKANYILKTSGTTLDGVATAKMIHPNHEDTWSVKAFVDGMAESDALVLNYKAVISDFDLTRSTDNRKITVGPLFSFMHQMIPDGLEVTLDVYRNDILIETLRKGTSEGYVNFKLNPNQFPKGNYTFKVHAASITKTLNAVALW